MAWTSWILVGLYVIIMLQAFFYHNKITSSKCYISAERKISSNTAVVSTMMTTVAVPLFLILPGVAHEEGGILNGLILSVSVVLGAGMSYFLIAERLRLYSEIMGGCNTVPSYISSRFRDGSGWLRAFSASLVTVFMVLLAAFAISRGAEIASVCFGMGKVPTVILLCGVSLVYLYLGGIPSAVRADRLRSPVLLLTAIAMFGFALFSMIFRNDDVASVREISKSIEFGTFEAADIFSYGFMFCGCIGFPTAAKRYLMIKERKPPKQWTVLILLWSVICACGIIFSVYVASNVFDGSSLMDILLSQPEGSGGTVLFQTVIDALILVSFVLALSAIADGAMLAAATTFSADIFNISLTHETNDRKCLLTNKLTVVAVAVAVMLLSLSNADMPIMEPRFIWATMGACFGPVILFSLYCKRLTLKGAVASMITGLLTVLVWKFVLSSIGGIFSFYEMLPGVILSTLALYLVSYIDRQKPSARMLNEFGRMKELVKMQKE